MDEKTKKANFYVWDDIVVDAHRAVVMRGGERLTITAKVVDLLLILLERRGHIVEKAELMELLWPNSFVEEANLAQNVAVLRRALGDNPKAAKLIRTIPGRGYEFVGAVSVRDTDEPPVIAESNPTDVRRLGIGYALTVGALAALLLAAGAYFFMRRDSEPKAAGVRRVVVLPLKPVNLENRDPISGFPVYKALLCDVVKCRSVDKS